MIWQSMRVPGSTQDNALPGDRGRYLLWLEPPLVEGNGHYVHFSWKDESFCIRDYILHLERRQEPGVSPQDIWVAAVDRIPCKGELYVPVENFQFWTSKLTELMEKRNQGSSLIRWSGLSSKFAPKPNDVPRLLDDNSNTADGIYQKFMVFWRRRAGFDVIERTVGCSARFQGEPLLWVYPTHFQVAPQGKGNTNHGAILKLRHDHFPELVNKGTVGFNSPHFSWDRFQLFVNSIQEMVQSS